MFWRRKHYLPMIFQEEVTECGLACVTMILNYHQVKIDLFSLRQQFDSSLKGTSLGQLSKIIKQFGLDTKIFKIQSSQITTIKMPCIAFWESKHFVVIKAIQKDKIILHDPAIGLYTLTKNKFNQFFSGYVLETVPTNNSYTLLKKPTVKFKKYLNVINQNKLRIFATVCLTIMMQGTMLASPLILQKLINDLYVHLHKNIIMLFVVFFSVFKVTEAILYLLRALMIIKLEEIITKNIGLNTLSDLLKASYTYFEKRLSANLINRFNAIEKVREVISHGLPEGIVDGLISFCILIIAFYYCIWIGLLLFITSFFYLIIRINLYKKSRLHNEIQIIERSKEYSILTEIIKGIAAIKAFSKEQQSLQKWYHAYQRFLHTSFKIDFYQTILDAFRILLNGIQIITGIMIYGLLSDNHTYSFGALYALLIYTNQYSKSISNLFNKVVDASLLRLNISKLKEFSLLPATPKHYLDNKLCSVCDKPIEHIELKNICYRYSSNEPWVLKNINLIIHKNERIAITGQSGLGKTTLLKLMMGLIEPTEGSIWVNHQQTFPCPENCFRKKMAAVMQNDQLFTGTIQDNIAFFDEIPVKKNIEFAAKIAQIHDTIIEMPMQYNSYIGDMGSALSGGQKQRIILARALYKKPEVLFMDEATSHLDKVNELRINEALSNLNLIQVIVAHRQETINMASRVLDMNNLMQA